MPERYVFRSYPSTPVASIADYPSDGHGSLLHEYVRDLPHSYDVFGRYHDARQVEQIAGRNPDKARVILVGLLDYLSAKRHAFPQYSSELQPDHTRDHGFIFYYEDNIEISRYADRIHEAEQIIKIPSPTEKPIALGTSWHTYLLGDEDV